MGIKVWAIVEGPKEITEEDEDLEAPEFAAWYMVCKAEIDGEMHDANFWFENLNDAYDWQKHFSRTIEPITVNEQYKEYLL